MICRMVLNSLLLEQLITHQFMVPTLIKLETACEFGTFPLLESETISFSYGEPL